MVNTLLERPLVRRPEPDIPIQIALALGSDQAGRSEPLCGQMGRFDQTCNSVGLPMTPA